MTGIPVNGVKMRNARTQAGLTAQQVADSMGVAVQTVYGYESGQFNPVWENLIKYSHTVGVKDPMSFVEKDSAYERIGILLSQEDLHNLDTLVLLTGAKSRSGLIRSLVATTLRMVKGKEGVR